MEYLGLCRNSGVASLNGADTAEKKLTIAMEFGLGVAASCLSFLLLSRFVLEIWGPKFVGPRFYRRTAQGELVKTSFKGVVMF